MSDRDTLTALLAGTPGIGDYAAHQGAGHREALASLVLHSAESRPGSGICSNEHAVADAILTAGWRPPAQVITDPAALDALPDMSAVRRGDLIWQLVDREYGGEPIWQGIGSPTATTAEVLAGGDVTVLHAPENGDTE